MGVFIYVDQYGWRPVSIPNPDWDATSASWFG